MKTTIAFALCALLACQAGARTLYVDASRPNNSGNGLKAATAKKTIQSAINIAKKGDTIIVLPGSYAPIDTKNRKIKIKTKGGAAKTTIAPASKTKDGAALVKLGKSWSEKRFYTSAGYNWWDTWKSGAETKGTNTSLSGFSVVGDNWNNYFIAVSGGKVGSCVVRNCSGVYGKGLVCRAKMTGCTIDGNSSYAFLSNSSLDRCTIVNNNPYSWYPTESSKFSNCLFSGNQDMVLKGCTLANCTVADNTKFAMSKSKAYNTIFYKVSSAQFKKSKKNTLKSCYKGSNPKFVALVKEPTYEWIETDPDTGAGYYDETGTPADYHLQAGSPCINKGTKTAAAKKLYGSKDLDGKKRVKGKSVDIGCYEY